MRIGFANAYYNPNRSSGGNAHVYQFITNVKELGHQIYPWSGQDKRSVLLQRLFILPKLDVIYFRLTHKAPRSIFIGDKSFSKLIGSPLIIWEFNTIPELGMLKGKTEEDVQKEIGRFIKHSISCDMAICVSKALADYVSQKFEIKKIVVVPNGSDPSMFHPNIDPTDKVRIDPTDLNVVWIGSADINWHNFDLLLGAAKILHETEEGKKIKFHLIGQGIEVLQDLTPNVYNHGPVNYHELPQWLSPMDVGLVLYKPGIADYNSPLKMFDYMASGLLILGTKHPQISEIYSEIGLSQQELIPHNDSTNLSTILLELLNNREKIRRVGNAGRKLVLDKYNWRKSTQSILNEIEMLRLP